MTFDPATATLSPMKVTGSAGGAYIPTALAYRAANNGTSVYVGQLPGGPVESQLDGMAFSIDSGSTLNSLPGSPFLAGSDARTVAMPPSGKFVYFSQNVFGQWQGIAGYSLDANGIPQPLAGSPFYPRAIGDAGMVVDPQGQFLFAMPPSVYLNSSDSQVYTFPIAADGSLGSPAVTAVSPTVVTANGGGTCLQVSPDGKYLYVALNGTIAVLTVDPQTGALTPLPGSPFPVAIEEINSFAMSSDGNFLFASGCCVNAIEVFATNRSSTGILTPLPTVTPGGTSRYALATQGHFVFVGMSVSQDNFTGSTVTGSISVYALDSTIGTLTFKGNLPTPGGPETMIAIP